MFCSFSIRRITSASSGPTDSSRTFEHVFFYSYALAGDNTVPVVFMVTISSTEECSMSFWLFPLISPWVTAT